MDAGGGNVASSSSAAAASGAAPGGLKLDQDQLNVILEVLGTPSEEDIVGLGLSGPAGATVR
eukprot:32558-Eustigmatos_ZCMA.PRE.1